MRRLIGGSPPKQQERTTRQSPLEKESSKRRTFAFLNYSPDRRTNKPDTMHRTREQHKQIAIAVASSRSIGQETDQFNSFRATTPPNAKLSKTESLDFDSASFGSGGGSSYGALPADAFRKPSPLEMFVEKQQGSSRSGSLVSESSEARRQNLLPKSVTSMPTFPSNSTMNARNLHHPSSASASASPSPSSAAARRRARRQQDPTGTYQDLGPAGDQQDATPPSSPFAMHRMMSNLSVSSNISRGSTPRAQNTNHLPNYSQTPRGLIDHPSPGASTYSHASTDVSFFKTDFDHQGFSFDAFGLDEHLVDQEVSRAIRELQSTSLFYQEEFPPQSFDSPPGSFTGSFNGCSRSATPVDEDGFEDGFRVTVPVMASASPGSSDRSSLTESTGKSGRTNMFKEQAGWSSQRIPPADANWADFGKYRTSPPGIPDIRPPRSDVGARSDFGPPSSAGAQSDVAFQSDVGVNSDVMMGGRESDEMEIPMEVVGKKGRKARDLYEEKKEEIIVPPSEKSVASLKGKWKKSQIITEDQITPPRSRISPESRDTKPTQSVSAVSLRSVHKEPISEREKRVQECAQQRTSLSSLRERLKSSQSRPNVSSSKSDVGGPLRSSPQLNSVMSRVHGYGHAESSSPRETQSEVGQPAFLSGVKLRSTGGVAKFDSPPQHQQQQHNVEDTWPEESSDQQDFNDCDRDYQYEEEVRTLSYKERREMELRQQQQEQIQGDRNYKAESSSQRHPRKLTYRELREKELREQEIEARRLQAKEEARKPKDLDVAALIRKRIAANKQKASMMKDSDSVGGGSGTAPIAQGRLKRVSMESKITQFRAPVEREPEVLSPREAGESDALYVVSPDAQHASLDETGESLNRYDGASPETSAPRQQQRFSRPAAEEEEEFSSGPPKASAALANLFVGRSALMGPPHTGQSQKEEPIVEQRQESISASSADTKKQLTAFFANRLAGGPSLEPSNQPLGDEEALRRSKQTKESLSAASQQVSTTTDTAVVSEPPSAGSRDSDSRPALKDDPKYDRFFKMLKVGMPLEVVKHAMTRDGVDPSVMDGDHNKPAGYGSGVPLKDDPKYEKYFKMLKMGLPMGAVQNAMERDGLDSSVMARDHSLPANGNAAGGEVCTPAENLPKDTHRRTRLHWDTMRKVRSNSLWAKIDQDEEIEEIDIDEEEFAQLFQAELAPTMNKSRPGASTKRGAAVRVIDSKRANNGGIILARLKMTHDEMADAVDRIDDNAMTSEQMQNIIEYLPTLDERKALETYMLSGGTDAAEKFDGLCECEKFMVAMMTVKYAKQKVRALLFKLQFGSCLQSLVKDTAVVETACDELSNSVRLRKLLGIVLNIGNRLNTAGVSSKQKAGAFKLESLLKLSQAKAFDKKTTFLHYIVLVVQRNNELLLRFKDDLPTVLKADKVYWDQCVTDLEEVENQLENVRRIALHQARLALSYRIKKTKSRNTDDDGESFSDCSMSLEEEVELLRATPIGIFTLAAIKKVSTLRDKVEATKAKFAKLLEYFGEDDKQDMQPHVLFNIMVTFCKDFEKAKEQVYASTKAKMREDRKTQVSNKNVPPSPQTPVRPTPPKAKEPALRLSSLQPNMSTVMKAKSPDAQLRDESRRKSPKNPNDGYSKEPPPGVARSQNSLQQANAAARPHNGQYSKQPSPALTRPQNGPYSKQPGPVLTSPQNGYSKQLAPMAPTYSRSPTEANQPLADANDETSVGSGASPRSKVLGSPILTYDPNSSMRQKARMQRQRMSGRSSVSSSTSVTSSTTGTSNASVVRPPLDQTKQQQLSPRSSIRQRRRTEIRRSRDGAGTEWPDTTDQISEQLEVD